MDLEEPKSAADARGVASRRSIALGAERLGLVALRAPIAREDRPGADPTTAVARSTVLIGPALILTAFVLACGLEALSFSDLPLLRLFGWLSAFAMVAALTADLLILRPTVAALLRLTRRQDPAM